MINIHKKKKEKFSELVEKNEPKYNVMDWIKKGNSLSDYVKSTLDIINIYIEDKDERFLATAYNMIKNVRIFLSHKDYYNIEEKLRKK